MNSEASVVASKIEDFIRDRFVVEANDEFFNHEINLFEEGYVDSAGVIEVIAFLEETFALTLPEDVLFDTSFSSIDGMAVRVAGLLES